MESDPMIGSYVKGFKDGQLQALQQFERLLSVLREELSDARRDRDYQMSRADAAADLLLQHLGTRAISLAGKQEEVERTERQVRAVSTLSQIGDPTEELPLGDPRGTYKNAREAGLFNEDVATVAG
jgi:hypothetical protein